MTQPYSAMGSVLVILGRGDWFMLVSTVTKKTNPSGNKDIILDLYRFIFVCVNVQWAGPPLLPLPFLYDFQWFAYFPRHCGPCGLQYHHLRGLKKEKLCMYNTSQFEELLCQNHLECVGEWVVSQDSGARQPILLNAVFEVLHGQASPWRVYTWTHGLVNKVEPLGLNWAENQDMPPCPVLRLWLLQPRGGDPFPHLCSFLPFISPLSYAIPSVLTISCSPGWTSLGFLGVVRHSCL